MDSLDDISFFRDLMGSEGFQLPSMRFGAMVETLSAVRVLERATDLGMLDFAVIGLNDLISDSLSLDRDDSANQHLFRVDNVIVRDLLKYISDVCEAHRVPYSISLPKYPDFLYDFGYLKGLGFRDFFAGRSILSRAIRQIQNDTTPRRLFEPNL